MEMDGSLRKLERLGMVETYGKRYSATRLGEMTNKLYLDPETVVSFFGNHRAGHPGDPTRWHSCTK